MRSLAEDIERGRRAVALGRARGVDTAAWEQELARLEREQLLAWAAELAEQQTVLAEPVSFVEAPLVRVTTANVSAYAVRYLRVLSLAESAQQVGTWGNFTVAWWDARTAEALGALAALRNALALSDRS